MKKLIVVLKAVLPRVALAVSLAWVVVLTLMFLVMLQSQARNEQSDAFRGQYQGMAIEGLSVLQQELSKANVRISILEQEKGKPLSAERPPWLNAPREPGTCAEPKEETSIEPESRFTIEEVK